LIAEQYAYFPALNATLNGASALLLLTGRLLIAKGRIAAHRACMITAFCVSCVFLVGYVTHKILVRGVHTHLGAEGAIVTFYYVMLISHIILAITIVPLAISVHPSVPARSVKELIALAKAKPGSLHYASSGNGSATHMATELFKVMTGTDIVHVPYSGGGPAVVAVVGGQVPIYTGSIPSQLQHIKAGKLVALAVTSATPDPALPGIPTVADAGVPGYEAVEWQGIVVPSGTPGAVIHRLNRALVESVKAPEFNERLAGVGAHAVGSTPAEFADYLKKELATWSRVIKATGIRIE